MKIYFHKIQIYPGSFKDNLNSTLKSSSTISSYYHSEYVSQIFVLDQTQATILSTPQLYDSMRANTKSPLDNFEN